MTVDKSIHIPTNHYVGFQKRSGDLVPLGFMTPDGTDAAAVKRKGTIDTWAHGYGYSSKKQATLNSTSFENKLMVGFRLGDSVRHGSGGWGPGNVKWRIEDPRGFELEITSPNMAQVLRYCTINNGEILEECIWGRKGADNVLLPVTSDVYQAATANTERLGRKVSNKDIKPGYYVELQNGEKIVYLGNYHGVAFSGLSSSYHYRNNTESESTPILKLTSGRKSFVGYFDKEKSKIERIDTIGTLKVANILTEEIITTEEALAMINQIANKGYNGIGDGIRAVIDSTTNLDEVQFELVPIDTATVLAATVNYRNFRSQLFGTVMVNNVEVFGQAHITEEYSGGYNQRVATKVVAIAKMNKTMLLDEHKAKYYYESRGSYYGQSTAYSKIPVTSPHQLYELKVSGKTKTGIEYTFII